MYAHPGCTYIGTEPIASIEELIEAVKRRQAWNPQTKLVMKLDGAEFRVSYLASGYIEIDGRVPSLQAEREIGNAITTFGASLIDVLEMRSCTKN